MTDTDGALSSPALYQQPWPDGGYRFVQLGFVVDDAVAAARRWAEVYGVGPFFVRRIENSPCTYRGEASTLSVELAIAQAGPVQIELIAQLGDNPSVYEELEVSGASGFHQISTVVADYAATLDHYRDQGFEVACEFRIEGVPSVAYIDTLEEFGFFTEVIEHSDAFLQHAEVMADSARGWDGTDPVRAVTPDGYRSL